MKKWRTLIAGLAFLAYVFWMLYLLFGQRMGQTADGTYWQQIQANVNLRPLETVWRFGWVLRNSDDPVAIRHAVINLAGNVVMFVPLGLLTPCIWVSMRKFWRHFLYMVLIIVSIEVLQLVTLLGSCDVDDLLLEDVKAFARFLQERMKNRK